MLSKSIAPLQQIERRIQNLSPLALSSLSHAFIFSLGLVILFYEPSKKSEKLDFDVVERAVQAPSPIQEAPRAKPKPKIEAQRQVFGVTKNALQADASDNQAPEIKAGNTVAKAQDNLQLKPGDADSLPIPADEFLVSQMPILIGDFRIPYPPEAKKRGIQGAVILDLLIDSSGKVRDVRLIEGPGAGLNEAAMQAVTQLKFKPAVIEDKPVAVKIRYSYKFVLEK